MKKVSNSWINGIFKAWEMMFYFPIENVCSRFIDINKNKLRGIHVLCGLLFSAFIAGVVLMIFCRILSWLAGSVPGAIIGALAVTLLWIWSDRGAAASAFANAISRKISGENFDGILDSLDCRPERLESGIASTLFAVMVLLKLVILYFVLVSHNYSMLLLVLLSGAFAQAFALNVFTGSGAPFGFDGRQDKKIFYILAIVMLLIAAGFNLPIALAFGGGSILWNYNVRENLVVLRGGKSDAAVTFYGECAALIALLIAFVYSAGSFAAR